MLMSRNSTFKVCTFKFIVITTIPLRLQALLFLLGGTMDELFRSLFHEWNSSAGACWNCVTETQGTVYGLTCF